MALFQKKKEGGLTPPGAPSEAQAPPQAPSQAPPPAPSSGPVSGVPIDQVMNLRQQGLTNNQIIQTLQRDGYDSGQIFDALNQADIKGGSASPLPEMGVPAQDPNLPGPEMQPPPGMPPSGPMPPPGMPPLPQGAPMGSSGGFEKDRIEELAEAIIDEKWDELMKNISKITEWKDKTEQRMTKFEQELADFNKNFTSLQQGVLGKISEYDQNILNVGIEVKAMEKVFQKLIPTFTENVNELSRVTKGLKKK